MRLLTLALVCASGGARAGDWHFLPGETRAVPLTGTASRDAPLLEYAFGPSGQISLGHDFGILAHDAVRGGDFRLGIGALVALEDATSGTVFPDELARIVGTLDGAWTFTLGAVRMDVGLQLGVERARELVGAESERVDLAPDGDDIPFGGGGVWLGADVGVSLPLAPRWTFELRVADRMFFNAFPLLFGLDAESADFASYVGDALTHAPSLALNLRWRACDGVQPVARLFVEGLFPRDDSADAGVFARALVGVALPGDHGELLPFLSLDVGNGKGLLVNRHELRFSIGARHAF